LHHLPTLALLVAMAFARLSAQQPDTIPVPVAVQRAFSQGTRSLDGSPGRRYWQIRPEYTLQARLDPHQATVHGSGTLSFANTSPAPMEEIVLRLDQNRFRAGGSAAVTTRGIDLRLLVINGDSVDLGGPTVVGLTTTVLRVGLQQPLEPGQRLTMTAVWDLEVPLDEQRHALRQGRWGTEVFQVAQWYPRLAMYDDLEGWDVAPHDGNWEFYNPFARFDVQLVVPAGWLVGATGSLANPQEVLGPTALHRLEVAKSADTTLLIVGAGDRGGESLLPSTATAVWRFTADSVRDFAWGASDRYGWAVTSRMTSTHRVLVHSFMTARHREQLVVGGVEAADAIAALSDRIMPYAWNNHVLLDGPEGGMEYPGITFSHGGIIAHEIAHQWFPMMVGTDETRFDFLDEGFASFYPLVLAGTSVAQRRNAPAAAEPLLLRNDLRTIRMVFGYGRGSRMLQSLAAQVGEERLLDALRAYAIAWRFKHPSPWDFMAIMERSLGEELDAFWLRWLFSNEAVSP
jgi:hypothetical protein